MKKEGKVIKKKAVNNVLYYSLLLLLIIFTSGLAFLLMPLILVGNAGTVYIISATMGIVFGLLIVFFVMSIDELTHHHHAGIWVVILFGSLINFTAVFLNESIIIDIVPELVPMHPANTFVAAGLFALGFYLPYLVYLINERQLDKHAQKSH